MCTRALPDCLGWSTVRSIAAVVFALLLATAACGSSDVKRRRSSDALKDRTDLTNAQVTCVVNETFDTFDQDTINDLYTSSDRKDLADKDEQQFEKIVEGLRQGLTDRLVTAPVVLR